MNLDHQSSPIIATGTQRSGTTLLFHILNCSSRIWSQNELYPVNGLIFDRQAKNRNQELARQIKELMNVEISPESAGESVESRVRLLSSIMQGVAEKHGKPRWCLKDPRASYYLNEYAEALPDSQFIIMVRDPRAVVRSYLAPKGFRVGRPANTLTGAERWCDEVSKQMEFADRFPDRTQVVKYEEMIQHLKGQLESITDFLKIPLDREMLEYYKHSATTRIHDGNENILTAPNPDRMHAWRSELSPTQVSIVETRCEHWMQRLGYNREQPAYRFKPLEAAICRWHHRFVYEYRWRRFQLTGKS